MNTFNRKNISVALLISLGAIFSLNANAEQSSNIENSLTAMVVAQGQQVVSDLTVQVQQSIEAELNSFSVDFSFDESITESLAWLDEKQTTAAVDKISQNEKLTTNQPNTKSL